MGDGLTFELAAGPEELEITGSARGEAVRVIGDDRRRPLPDRAAVRPDGAEVTFEGSTDPNTPIAMGWLRASHRELDPERSTPYRPYHTHRRRQPLVPGEVYELDVEIWPTCIVVPPATAWR